MNKAKEDRKEEKRIIEQENKQKRKKSRKWKIFRLLLLIVLMISLIFAGIFAYKVIKNGGGLQGFIATAMGHNEDTLKDLDKINFLLIGISGYEDYKLADTIMLCSYNPKEQKASILSIPRDTYVGKEKTNPTQNYVASNKINSVYRNGENIDGMIKSVEEITGLEIKNYLVVDTEVLVELVDAIGGVEFDVPIDMKYDDTSQNLHIDLKAGYQKLNGKQAEWLVRFRHNNDGTSYSFEYGDNDFGRMRTQREFIAQTIKQTLKPSNILNINKISQSVFNNIKTNMTYDVIKDYIPYSVNFNTENLETEMLPGASDKISDIWVYKIDKKETEEVIEKLFIDKEIIEDTIEEKLDENNIVNTISSNNKQEELKIELLNGSGKEANLTKVTNLLKEKGYNVVRIGNTTTMVKTKIIARTTQKTTTTTSIKNILKIGETSNIKNNSNVDYTIIIGKDYK